MAPYTSHQAYFLLPFSRTWWISLFFTLICTGSWLLSPAQAPSISHFSRLTTEGGLTGNRTRCFVQDSLGYVWIGTQNGLNRYDGYEVRRYQREPDNAYSLPDNFIHTITLDQKGHLWVGTARAGICRYDPRQDQFHPLRDLQDQALLHETVVKTIWSESESVIWIGTHRDLHRCELNEAYQVVSHATFPRQTDQTPGMPRGMIMDIVKTDPNTVWAGTYRDGLIRIQLGADTLYQHFKQGSGSSPTFNHAYLHDLEVDREGTLWIGTEGGAYRVSTAQAQAAEPRIERFSPDRFGLSEPMEGSVNHFSQDPAGNLWMISHTYLHRYLPEKDSLMAYSQADMHMESQGANVFNTMMLDNRGRIWISSMEGVYYANGRLPAFYAYPWQNEQPLVRAVAKDKFGYVWVGTEADGVHVFSPEGTEVLHINEGPKDLASPFVTEILITEEDQIWVGLFRGGLCSLTARRDKLGKPISVRVQRMGPDQLDQLDIEDIFLDREGGLWLATLRGLARWDSSLQAFHMHWVRWGNEVAQTTDGTIWLATSMGLFSYDESGDSLVHRFADPSSNFKLAKQMFLTIWADQKGALWAGTPHGLYWLKPGQNPVLYQEKEGLAGNLISALVGDQQGGLWIGSQQGLSKFEPDKNRFANYFQADGILHRDFSTRATFLDKQGRLYLGGDNGLLSFHPDSLSDFALPTPPMLTDIQVYDQSLSLDWQEGPEDLPSLPYAPSYLPSFSLDYAAKAFSLSFASLGFGATHRLNYRYRLQGFEEQWHVLSLGQRVATYTNLSPGTYHWEVQASMDGHRWTEAGSGLSIRIRPPWYRTWWAFAGYAFLACALIIGLLMLRVQQLERRYREQARIAAARVEEQELVRRRSAQDFHDEAGNRLTKLSLYTELTKRLVEKNEPAQNYLGQIERNLSDLSHGMRDFIWVLNPENDSLGDMLKRLLDFGNALFEHSETQFRSHIQLDEWENLKLDINLKRHLLLIFKEAMNNCLKYAEAKTAWFEAKWEEEEIVMVFGDSGKGFDPETQTDGQGLRNMHSRAGEMGLNLYIQSEKGSGTDIEVKLNITQMGNSIS